VHVGHDERLARDRTETRVMNKSKCSDINMIGRVHMFVPQFAVRRLLGGDEDICCHSHV